MDRGEVVSVTERMTVPAGTFVDVVKIEETTPLEPGTKECRSFLARGAGLIADGHLKLVRFGPGVEWSPTVLNDAPFGLASTLRSSPAAEATARGHRQFRPRPAHRSRQPRDLAARRSDAIGGSHGCCWILF